MNCREENKVLHSLGCKLKPVLAKDGGTPDHALPVSSAKLFSGSRCGTSMHTAAGYMFRRH